MTVKALECSVVGQGGARVEKRVDIRELGVERATQRPEAMPQPSWQSSDVFVRGKGERTRSEWVRSYWE